MSKSTIVLLMMLGFIIGFMIKLPKVFSEHDKELHFLFYFCVTVFFSALLARRKIVAHLVIAYILWIFGVLIEYLQELSNSLVTKRIHGNFDSLDIVCNTAGIICGSFLWLCIRNIRISVNNTTDNGK